MGLLSRASTLDSPVKRQGLAFSDFINKHSIKICALLEQNGVNYTVSNSIGFDAHSIIRASSTADFWDGICKTSGEIYTFTDSDKNQLLQLFSFNLKDNLFELSAYKNSNSQILLCEGSLTKEAAKDFETISSSDHQNDYNKLNPLIKDNSVVLMFDIDFLKAFENLYKTEYKDNIPDFEIFLKAIMNETYNRFACRYNISDTTVKNSSHSLKTVIITDKAYSVELISKHILLNLKEVFDNFTDQIKIHFSGTADSCEKIQAFLQAE